MNTPEPHATRRNALLAALPAADYERLRAHLQLVELSAGKTVYESTMPLQYAYFPTTALLSMMCVMQDGRSLEVAVVDSEGMVGVSVLAGGSTAPVRVVVRSGGQAYRISRTAFDPVLLQPGSALGKVLVRFAQALLAQIVQIAGCNGLHTIEQRLCRWLLQAADFAGCDEIRTTQESIADMLGVRRAGVTEAAGRLQAAGLIELGRGCVRLVDRSGLQARACECYDAVHQHYARLLLHAPVC